MPGSRGGLVPAGTSGSQPVSTSSEARARRPLAPPPHDRVGPWAGRSATRNQGAREAGRALGRHRRCHPRPPQPLRMGPHMGWGGVSSRRTRNQEASWPERPQLHRASGSGRGRQAGRVAVRTWVQPQSRPEARSRLHRGPGQVGTALSVVSLPFVQWSPSGAATPALSHLGPSSRSGDDPQQMSLPSVRPTRLGELGSLCD